MYLVTGATGNVGRAVVEALAAEGREVRALTRSGNADGFPTGVTAVAGNLDEPSSLTAALDGVRGVFLLPGYADMPGVLAEAAKAGVERVVQLSGMSAGSGDRTNAVTAYMAASEDAVRASGLDGTILRPAAFMANTLRWLPQLRAGDVVREAFAEVPAAMTDPYDIGRVAAVALTEEGHAGKVYELSGPEAILPADRVRILAEELGRDLRFEAIPDDVARVEMEAAMPKPYVDAFFDFYVDGNLDESRVLPTVEEVTGTVPRGFREWVRAHVGELG
ncbi:MAG TPA: NAD(P)H-binding protein [Phytomonospora sp.]